MENDLFKFSGEQLEKKANKEILKLSEDKSSVAEPSAYILGGQPGAGKTALQKIIMEQCNDNVIIVNGDEFRKKHPNFDEIQKEYGKDASIHTQKFSGKMTENIIDKLSDYKYNLIIEGTLRTSDVPLDTQKKLAHKGYKTELSVIAVKPEISYLGTISRYEDMYVVGQNPRATPKEQHDKVVEAIPNNIDVIYGINKFDNITIYNRSGECLYNQKDTPQINPKDIILNTFSREWNTKEIENIKNDIGKIIKNMQNRNALELDEFKKYANDLIKKVMGVESIKNKIIDLYKVEFPAIKHITEKTATIMDKLNEKKGHVHTIKEIKAAYIDAGKNRENSDTPFNRKSFNELEEVYSNLNQCNHKENQIQAHEKAQTSIQKNIVPEI